MSVDDGFEVGDSVVLDEIHESHNRLLRRRLGNVGRVEEVGEAIRAGQYLVRFESASIETSTHYWIRGRWLKPAKREAEI